MYTVDEFEFDNGKKGLTRKHAVYTTDASDLALFVLDARNQIPHNILALVGIDKGKDYFKIILTLIPLDEAENEANHFKFSGVQRAIPLAIAAIDEYHFNIELLFTRINIWGLKCFFALDFKMKNILIGLQGHSCMHPCGSCDCDKYHLDTKGEPRTVKSLALNFEGFTSESWKKGANIENLNVVNRPLFHATLEESKQSDELVIDFISPAELHIMLGLVNDTHKELKKVVEWEEEVDNWVRKSLARSEVYHGGNFEVDNER